MRTLMLAILLALGCGADRAVAQVVRGAVLQEGTGTPVPAALLILLDESGRHAGGALSDDAGGFLIRAPRAGRYRIRVQRIGFESALSPAFDLAAGEVLDRNMIAPVARIEGITVEARSRCAVRPQVGRSTAALWEEARKALEAAAFTERARLYRFRVRRYERDLDPETLRISNEKQEIRTVLNHRPFTAQRAEYLLEHGFVETDAGGRTYYAPDAEVLLSDRFLEGYCFQMVTGDSGRIGLSFRPVSGQGPPAIRGTLWMDRETLELRRIEYRYTRLALPEGAEQWIGGQIDFEALPSGAWIIRRWWIRMPSRVTRTLVPSNIPQPLGSRAQGIVPPTRTRTLLSGIREEGGEVLELLGNDPNVRAAARGPMLHLSPERC